LGYEIAMRFYSLALWYARECEDVPIKRKYLRDLPQFLKQEKKF
jgi:hypothetical protein